MVLGDNIQQQNPVYGANPYAQQYYYGNPVYNYAGVNANQPKIMNVLNQEEIQKLMTKKNDLVLMVTETDLLRSFCNHRKADGTGDTLTENPDGTCRCEICNYTFKPIDAGSVTEESIKQSVQDIIDLLQTIKLIFVDLDPKVAREYFQIIPLIEKIPEFFQFALKNWSKHEGNSMFNMINGRNLSTAQLFAQLTGMFMSPQGAYQAPYQNDPTNVYGQSNGFVNTAPGYQPMTNGYQYNYAQPMMQPMGQPMPQPMMVNPAAQFTVTPGQMPVQPQPTPNPAPTTAQQVPVVDGNKANNSNVKVDVPFTAG